MSTEGEETVSSTGKGGSMGGAVFSSFADESSEILDGCQVCVHHTHMRGSHERAGPGHDQ